MNNLRLQKGCQVVVIGEASNDQKKILQRFMGSNKVLSDITVQPIYSIKDAIQFVEPLTSLANYFFIVNENFPSDSTNRTGIDFIEQFKIGDRSALISNYWSNDNIISKSKRLGFKLISKSQFDLLPITLCCDPIQKVVLIDDELLFLRRWQIQAERDGIRFEGFASLEAFLKQLDQGMFDSSWVICIDDQLGDGVIGSREIEKIIGGSASNQSELRNIFLATCTKILPDDLDCSHLTGIISKVPLWKRFKFFNREG